MLPYHFDIIHTFHDLEAWKELNPNQLNHLFSLNNEHNFKYGSKLVFEGLVRNFNENKMVESLYYEGHEAMMIKEGTKILAEVWKNFDLLSISCFHRLGLLQLGEIAIKVVVFSKHRQPGFTANQTIINQIKLRLPVWKKENYCDGSNNWIFCQHLPPN